MIERTKKIQINPTTDEIAKAFCDMDADEQANFFNIIGVESKKWKMPFSFQLQSIKDSVILTNAGRDIMHLIGDYSGKGIE